MEQIAKYLLGINVVYLVVEGYYTLPFNSII